MRKFRYTGNIAHIRDYIKKNCVGKDCMVEIYVRPLTKSEREIYGLQNISALAHS